jgi:HAD superfamily hydrolase (TIGR01509 family)
VSLILPPPPAGASRTGAYGAFLFDCDGTIADSMPLHYRAWRTALDPWGCEFPEDRFYAWGGRTVVDIIEDLNAEQGLAMPVKAVADQKEEAYQRLMPEMTAVPEVVEHVHRAYGLIPLAVVSGSTRESVVATLEHLGLLDRFDALVCAGEYTRPKPDPECFLIAARMVKTPASDCLVFEDTDFGIQAASAAGMASVRVPPPGQRTA